MKIVAVLLALPMLGLCQKLTFRSISQCTDSEATMPILLKCVSEQQYCGGGNYTDGKCICHEGYRRAGLVGNICIPKCIGTTGTCRAAGGTCTAVNFCSCGDGFKFYKGMCLYSKDDLCKG